MNNPTNTLVGLETTALGAPPFNTNLGQDLTSAGSDFGNLILGVGNAVAATQQKLTETSAATASTLAKTLVNVIAVQETIYDDQGNITGSQSFVSNLPLINFIDPVFYQWSQVRLQGQFFISEIATATTSHTGTFVSNDSSGQHGLFVFLGGGHTNVGFTSTTTDQATQSDRAQAVGRARMYAQLNPRSDTGVPKPTKVIRGPSINLVQGEIKDIGGPPPTSRTLSMLVQLRKNDGSPISGKAVSIDTDGTPWAFSADAVTGVDGNVAILLTRTFVPVPQGAPAGTTVDTSPQEVVITARLGLVANRITVKF